MKNTTKLAAVLFILQFQLFAQAPSQSYLDSLYQRFALNRIQKNAGIAKYDAVKPLPEKCGTSLAYEVRKNFNYFTATQKSVMKPMLDRPELDTSFVTPQKHFRIHFYKTGAYAPKYDLNLFAQALDSAYNFEINYLKYPAPPSDNGEGGDDLYDVYLIGLGNVYGYTQFNTTTDEVTPGSNTYRSYMEIDNAFDSTVFPTVGINGARVTVAHEFHHAIQIGNYIFREEDRYFLELTSTSMEDFVFSTINDYFNYNATYFRRPYRCFSRNQVGSGDGYDLAIWHFFLQKKYGFDIIKKEWEYLVKYPSIQAVDKALRDYNSSFLEAYNEFGLWCYFTNYRAVQGKYFDDAKYYPLLTPFLKLDFYSPSKTVEYSVDAASNAHLFYVNAPQIDTLMIVCTNGDVQGALQSQTGSPYSCAFSLYDYNETGSKKISAGYYTKFDVSGSYWLQSQILNNEIVEGDSLSLPSVSYPFPAPFEYNKNSRVYLPVTNTDVGMADVFIYNSSMRLVYTNSQMIDKYIDKKVIKWDGRDKSGGKLASGIYLYAIKTKNSTIKGKLAIINN
jgi:hypothetical protein